MSIQTRLAISCSTSHSRISLWKDFSLTIFVKDKSTRTTKCRERKEHVTSECCAPTLHQQTTFADVDRGQSLLTDVGGIAEKLLREDVQGSGAERAARAALHLSLSLHSLHRVGFQRWTCPRCSTCRDMCVVVSKQRAVLRRLSFLVRQQARNDWWTFEELQWMRRKFTGIEVFPPVGMHWKHLFALNVCTQTRGASYACVSSLFEWELDPENEQKLGCFLNLGDPCTRTPFSCALAASVYKCLKVSARKFSFSRFRNWEAWLLVVVVGGGQWAVETTLFEFTEAPSPKRPGITKC